MDKYNKGLMLGGGIGNAYTQTTIADSALAMAESGEGGAGMMGLAMGLGCRRRNGLRAEPADGALTRRPKPTLSPCSDN